MIPGSSPQNFRNKQIFATEAPAPLRNTGKGGMINGHRQMNALRPWATPLTFATFLIVGVTGIVLFFHTGGTLSRVAHEWIGFAVMIAAIAHVALNWRPFTRYVKKPVAATIMILGIGLTIATSVNFSAADASAQLSPARVFGALQTAPISAVAQVAGKDPAGLISDLAAQGYTVASPDQSIRTIAQGDSGTARTLLGLVFAQDTGA